MEEGLSSARALGKATQQAHIYMADALADEVDTPYHQLARDVSSDKQTLLRT